MIEVLLKALNMAIADAQKFQIFVTMNDIKHCTLRDVDLNLDKPKEISSDAHIDLGIASKGQNNRHMEFQN